MLGEVANKAAAVDLALTACEWRQATTENLDGRSLRQAVDAMADWLRNGAIAAPSRSLFALREAAAAHGALEEHRIQGRVLLVPDR